MSSTSSVIGLSASFCAANKDDLQFSSCALTAGIRRRESLSECRSRPFTEPRLMREMSRSISYICPSASRSSSCRLICVLSSSTASRRASIFMGESRGCKRHCRIFLPPIEVTVWSSTSRSVPFAVPSRIEEISSRLRCVSASSTIKSERV